MLYISWWNFYLHQTTCALDSNYIIFVNVIDSRQPGKVRVGISCEFEWTESPIDR